MPFTLIRPLFNYFNHHSEDQFRTSTGRDSKEESPLIWGKCGKDKRVGNAQRIIHSDGNRKKDYVEEKTTLDLASKKEKLKRQIEAKS